MCGVYAEHSKCKTVKELRWELFQTKNFEAEHLPPTLGALKPHVQRANLMTQVSKGYKEAKPDILPLVGNGWETTSCGVQPVKSFELPAPLAVIELVKCGCHETCSSNCSCKKKHALYRLMQMQ